MAPVTPAHPALRLAPVPPAVPAELVAVAVRSAAEGIPVAAIARIVRLPYDRVLHYLQRARRLGAITEIPRADWPVNQNERRPALGTRPLHNPGGDSAPTPSPSSVLPPEDVAFLCRHVFHLTNLEAGFLVVLLRCLFAEKEKLHAVIEQQRSSRPLRPDRQEVTDVKMVDVMICKLRKKLNATTPALAIRTSWGKGYFLDAGVKEIVYQILDDGVAGSAAREGRFRPAG